MVRRLPAGRSLGLFHLAQETDVQALVRHQGLVAPLDRASVDTDQIIPKQFLKRIERSGFGQFVFYDWRLTPEGQSIADFVLNQPRYRGASVLLTRANFGCGSSREHAPWALLDYGFRVLIAPSFADIFYNNCFKNGILPITLDEAALQELFQRTESRLGYQLTADLENCTLQDDHGFCVSFSLDAYRRRCLMQGLDDIGLTMQHEDKILAYEKSRS